MFALFAAFLAFPAFLALVLSGLATVRGNMTVRARWNILVCDTAYRAEGLRCYCLKVQHNVATFARNFAEGFSAPIRPLMDVAVFLGWRTGVAGLLLWTVSV